MSKVEKLLVLKDISSSDLQNKKDTLQVYLHISHLGKAGFNQRLKSDDLEGIC